MADDPIATAYRARMNIIADVLDDYFNPDPNDKRICFTLLITEFGNEVEGRANYISNGDRTDMVAMMRGLIARWEREGTAHGTH